MPPCSPRKSFTCLLHSNYWENCERVRVHEDHYQFNEDQFYEGECFRDSFHGQGTYKWEGVAVYEGGFYSNFKEGYGSLSLPDNSHFEGLFIKNKPFGPGILTHSNGRQDAGFWVGKKLVRLSRAVDFIIPRLAPTSAAKIKLLQFRRLIPLENNESNSEILRKYGYLSNHFSKLYSSLIYDPRSVFFETQTFEKTYFVSVRELSKKFLRSPKFWENFVRLSGEIDNLEEEPSKDKETPVPPHCLCPTDVFEMTYKDPTDEDICERENFKGKLETGILAYFTKFGANGEVDRTTDEENDLGGESFDGEEEEDTKCPKILSWNRSALCTEMLKQIFRYRAFEEKLHFNLGKLMIGDRTAFRKTGEKEMQCVHFLKMCSFGPAHVVKDLLCTYDISEELMDARGNNSLMFAAASDQHDIIDILLDHGVDVNTFNDESLTPLNLCLLRRLAQTEGICNWETAFLPKEIDTSLEYPSQPDWQSISSLDRIFGDGMSIFDNKPLILEHRFYGDFSTMSSPKEAKENIQRIRESREPIDIYSPSQITILNISKSPGTYSLVLDGSDDEPRRCRRSAQLPAFNESYETYWKSTCNEFATRMEVVPKSNRRDEFEKSVNISSGDTYLFEYCFDKTPNDKKGVGNSIGKSYKAEEEDVDDDKTEATFDSHLADKLAKIDKTIEKLLKRGADPDISEVPKPSIHLGVHTKDLNIVSMLLQHGASPDRQLYSNEGLLTPLHVIVLQNPAIELVNICELLLNSGANPEKETTPEFFICEEEKKYLDSERGRTPLQLLCMRPDLEYADPDGYLISIALMLAKVSSGKRFYNGHTYLTLAMLCGNIKLLKALLGSELFDSNEILEKNRGTSLHFLVSTEFQKKISYENSIRMCDLLIENKANPLKEVSNLGSCIDYGRREIETEKQSRKSVGKKEVKPEKNGRDHLKDHEKVVDYLAKKASGMSLEKKAEKQSGRSGKTTAKTAKSRDPLQKEVETLQEPSIKGDGKTKDAKDPTDDTGRKEKGKSLKMEETQENGGGKVKKEKNENEQSAKIKKTKNQDDTIEEGKPTKESKKLSKKHQGETKDKSKTKKPETQTKNVKTAQSKKDLNKSFGKTDSNLQRPSKASFKSYRCFETCSETFPEKQRQILLRMFGNCTNIDINEFLVPYVVLRNGELYYRFQGNVIQSKEQYSLI